MPANSRTETYLLKLTPEEKKAFEDAAELAGLQVAGWLRMVARQAAATGLQKHDRQVPFLREKKARAK